MKTVDITSEAPTLQELLALADQDNLLLKTEDGREFVLAETDDLGLEIEQVSHNAQLIDFLKTRAGSQPTSSMADVRQRLGL